MVTISKDFLEPYSFLQKALMCVPVIGALVDDAQEIEENTFYAVFAIAGAILGKEESEELQEALNQESTLRTRIIEKSYSATGPRAIGGALTIITAIALFALSSGIVAATGAIVLGLWGIAVLNSINLQLNARDEYLKQHPQLAAL